MTEQVRSGTNAQIALNRDRQRELYGAPLGDRVRGLTTAASLWAASAVGMCAGAGLFVLGTLGSLLLLAVLHLLHRSPLARSEDDPDTP